MAILTGILILYFFSIVWVIIGFIKIKESSKIKHHQRKDVKISVIIPVRNEAETILLCLRSIEKQDYNAANFEIIIVNDHSTDATELLVNKYTKTSKLTIQLCALTDKTSKKEALKLGVKIAQFKVIATTDSDCVLPTNWLNNIANQFTKKIDMLLGPVMFIKKQGFLAAFQTLDMLAIQGMEFGMLAFRQPILNNAANLSYLKNAYSNVNGFDDFDTPSGDDIFLLEKFKSKKQSIKGLLAQDFIVETASENNIVSFLHQRIRWASKSKYYSNKLLLFFSGLVFIQNILMLFIYIGILFIEKYRLIFIILLVTKWLIDFILLFLVSGFFKRKSSMFYFIPVQFFYPIYILMVWIASITMKFEWKGRKY